MKTFAAILAVSIAAIGAGTALAGTTPWVRTGDAREQGFRLVLKRRQHRQRLVSAEMEPPLPRSAPPTPAA